jgi:hypothetical protein
MCGGKFAGADAHISPLDQREGTGRCGRHPLHFQFIEYAANYDFCQQQL